MKLQLSFPQRFSVALLSLAVLAVGLVQITDVRSAEAAPRAIIALDPDDDVAYANFPGSATITELPFNYQLAQGVKAKLEADCKATVVITRDASQKFVNRNTRKAAALAVNPHMMVSLAFNALTGSPWGIAADGGPRVLARPQDVGFGQFFLNQIPVYTGRPSTQPVSSANNFPLYPEYLDLAIPHAHVEALFIDHNYDNPVIKTGFNRIVDGVTAGILDQMNALGLSCSKYPARPSAEELTRLRNLGYANFQRYGADPVSMSTGNFVTKEAIFDLSGVGQQHIDLGLTYNAQSGRDSQVGFGWSFAYGTYTQSFDDGSVAVVMADGHTFVFQASGATTFSSPPGAFAALALVDATTLRWSTTVGESMTFTVDQTSGRGQLTGMKDRQGNTTTLAYSGAGSIFAKLASITDQAGQVALVTTDANGRITSFTRPGGDLWALGYSASGDLVSIASPRGTTRAFGYDGAHHMTSETGPDGVVYLRNTYDARSRVISQTNAVGAVRTIAYDDTSRTTTYTDTTGAKTLYRWDEAGRITEVIDPLGGSTKTMYDAD